MTHVAIAGGGISGLAASIALRNAGLTTEVFEREPAFSESGAALVLSPNGIKALDALGRGAGVAVRGLGHCLPRGANQPFLTPDGGIIPAMDYTAPDGRRIAAITYGDLEERFGAPQVTIRRSQLLAALLEAHGPEGLRAGSPVVGFRDEGDRVAVRLAGGPEARADVLLGADGLRSAVRGQLFGEEPPEYLGFVSVRGITRDVPVAPELAEGFNVGGRGAGMFCSALGPAEWYWSAGVRAEAGTWPRDAVEARAMLMERLAGWSAPVPQLIQGAADDDLLVTQITGRPALPGWSRGRVTLLGDAAHPMAPFLGQGANAALEDAVVLAGCLAAEASPVAALVAYEQARIERTARIALVSARIGMGSGERPRDGQVNFAEFLSWLYEYTAAGEARLPATG
jgi:2-polyprenyl-6-methoxyphenol hydroxylase-like FAD-dependent oxidoreductase